MAATRRGQSSDRPTSRTSRAPSTLGWPLPLEASDSPIGREGVARKIKAKAGEFANGLNARGAETQSPGLAFLRGGRGECAACQEGDIEPAVQVTHRAVFDDYGCRGTRRGRQFLARRIIGRMAPASRIGSER